MYVKTEKLIRAYFSNLKQACVGKPQLYQKSPTHKRHKDILRGRLRCHNKLK